MTDEKKMAFARQLVDAFQKLNAPIELLCIVGSFGDTQSDDDIIEMLELHNEGRHPRCLTKPVH